MRVTRFCTPDTSDTHRNTHMLHVSARQTLQTCTATQTCYTFLHARHFRHAPQHTHVTCFCTSDTHRNTHFTCFCTPDTSDTHRNTHVTCFCTPDTSDTHRNTYMLHVSARQTLQTRTATHAYFNMQWLCYYYGTLTKIWNVFIDISGSEKCQMLRKLLQRLFSCYLRIHGQTD